MSERLGSSSAPSWTALVVTLALCAPGAGCDPAPAVESDGLRMLDVTELAASLESGTLVIDVRERSAFEAGHVPGATWLDPDALRTTVADVDGQVVARPIAEERFSEAGLTSEDSVVVVGAGNDTDPARVAWTLVHYGHLGEVGLLDGGMQAWTDAGRDASTDDFPRGTTGYLCKDTRAELRVNKAWMLDHLGDDAVTIFDVRTPEEYEQGHIPGAINVNWTNNLTRDGSFRASDEIRSLHGDPPTDRTLVVYCRTGSRAAVSWALLSAIGYEDVRLYDGSWAEWSRDEDAPRE